MQYVQLIVKLQLLIKTAKVIDQSSFELITGNRKEVLSELTGASREFQVSLMKSITTKGINKLLPA